LSARNFFVSSAGGIRPAKSSQMRRRNVPSSHSGAGCSACCFQPSAMTSSSLPLTAETSGAAAGAASAALTRSREARDMGNPFLPENPFAPEPTLIVTGWLAAGEPLLPREKILGNEATFAS